MNEPKSIEELKNKIDHDYFRGVLNCNDIFEAIDHAVQITEAKFIAILNDYTEYFERYLGKAKRDGDNNAISIYERNLSLCKEILNSLSEKHLIKTYSDGVKEEQQRIIRVIDAELESYGNGSSYEDVAVINELEHLKSFLSTPTQNTPETGKVIFEDDKFKTLKFNTLDGLKSHLDNKNTPPAEKECEEPIKVINDKEK